MTIAIVLFALWILAVIVFQLSKPLQDRLEPLQFWLFGLLPAWRLFGPRPVSGDYRIFYRNRMVASQPFTEWRPIDPVRKASMIGSLFFHPQAQVMNILQDICFETCASQSTRNVYYQLLLQQVAGEVRRRERVKPGEEIQLQFQICWRTPATLQPLFHSHVHSI